MTREQMVDALYQRTPLFVPPESFAHTLRDWELDTVEVGGKPAFITAKRGPEFHFQSLDPGNIISRTMIREFLRPIIAAHGYATTRTPKDDIRQQRFNERYGFLMTAADDEYVTYSIRQVR